MRRFWIPALVACCLAWGVTAIADDVNVFFSDEGTVFDLAELRDGETRVFGTGERRLTAVRDGDEVQLSRGAYGDKQELEFTCNLGTDGCQVIVGDDDAKVLLEVERELECVNGIGDCDVSNLDVLALAGGAHAGSSKVIVKKIHDCKGEDDCRHEEIKIVHDASAAGDDLHWFGSSVGEGEVVVVDSIGTGPHIMHLGRDDKALLRCPEGDASLHVEKDEVGQTFLCPKHSVPMEKVAAKFHRKIVIEAEAEAEAEAD